MALKLRSVTFRKAVLWAFMVTFSTMALWQCGNRLHDETEVSNANWLQTCVAAQHYPCHLPPGQLPWDRSDYIKYLTDIDTVIPFSEPLQLGAALQRYKMGKIWSSIINCLGIGPSRSHVLRTLSGMAYKEEPFVLISDSEMKATYEDFNGVEVLMYQPTSQQVALRRGMVYLHGGGWNTGKAEFRDGLSRLFAKSADVVVISINYRLSPENVFPAGLDDCVIATKYFMTNAELFGVDKDRIAVAGDSTGGNLAAALALRARDEKWSPPLKAQVLFFPALQAINFNLPSYDRYRCNDGVDMPIIVTSWLTYAFGDISRFHLSDFAYSSHVSAAAKEQYGSLVCVSLLPSTNVTDTIQTACPLPNDALWDDVKDVFTNPYFAPLMSTDLTGLPPTYMSTVELDILTDECIIYAERLRQAGVPVVYRHDIAAHGVVIHVALKEAQELVADAVKFLDIYL